MKAVKYFFLVLLMSCGTSKVIYDYDDKIDFSQFKTFHFFEDVGNGLNEFDVKRATAILENELSKLDLTKVEKPDFFINIKAVITEVQNNNTIGIGIGSGGRNGGFGISGGIPIGGKKLNEKIIIEFVNAKNNELFWEGSLVTTIKEKRKPAERELYLKDVIQKILAKYPPK
ncbi:DUF4136 domain-containing protein [Polaribacter aestuariivivens]|uniref:DUF4136 domain-containing protein n=1 Tax=Polaribacter aestuariivivens TaxID=2304626 RepID=A0A5S3N4U8_9FLAO|nr:DUF4136 domain-containing protein [Polaribacter aestuariivivens]TMM29514.1 DUF4136 domain-containing protein [Polaribacter aestuariivivens]